jgi:hypothetical protein
LVFVILNVKQENNVAIQGFFDGFDIGNDRKLTILAPKGKGDAELVFGFVTTIQKQIKLVEDFQKTKEIPKTDKGRKERTWWWEQTDKATGVSTFYVRVVLGVASPVDLKGNESVLDPKMVASQLQMLKDEWEDNKKNNQETDEPAPTLFEAYSSMVNNTVRNLKDLDAVKAVLNAVIKASSFDEKKATYIPPLLPYIQAAKRYAPTRGK